MTVIRKPPQPTLAPRTREQRPAAAPRPAPTPFAQSSFTPNAARQPALDLFGGGAPSYAVPLQARTPRPAGQTPAAPASSATVSTPEATGGASTLATERLNDGSSNCLEQAYESAQPGDTVLLYQDADDPVGHAVVERRDGSIVDPREPGKVYRDRAEWEAAHTDYRNPAAVPQQRLGRVFSAPPGAQRDALLQELGLGRVANRAVADGVTPERQDAIRGELSWVESPREVEDLLSGDSELGALTPEEQDYLLQQLFEGAYVDDPGALFANAGQEVGRYPLLAQALGQAFDSGAVTPEQIHRLLGPEGFGSSYWSGDAEGYLGFASLVEASGSDALRGTVASALWNTAQGADTRLRESVEYAALRTAGTSSAAVRQLLGTAGTEAVTEAATRLAQWARDVGATTPQDNAYATTLGHFLQGLDGLPHTPETDALAGSIFLGSNESLMHNAALRTGLASYLATAQGSGGPEGVRRWDAILQNAHARELLFSTEMPLEARQYHLLFFMQRPDFDVSLLNTYEGNLGSIAAHEAQVALNNLDPSQVSGEAQLPAVPPELASQFPAIANLVPRPVTAASLQQSIPNPVTPAMAADYLDALANRVAGTGDPHISNAAVGHPVLAELFNFFVGGNPITEAHLDDYAGVGASGLRGLADQIRASSDPQFIAQALTLGGVQERAYFDNLGSFVDSIMAQNERTQGWMNNTRHLAQDIVKMGMSSIGMALGGPMLAASSNAYFGTLFTLLDAELENKPVSIPNLAAGAVLDFGVGALAPSFGARVGSLFSNWVGKTGGELIGNAAAGAFEAAGGEAANILRDPKLLEEIWADPNKRDKLLVTIALGAVSGAIPWDSITPRLQRDTLQYLKAQHPHLNIEVDLGAGVIADEAFKSSFTVAVMAFADSALQARVRAGELTLQEAIAQVQSQAVNLFGAGTEVDPALAEALLSTLLANP